MRIIEKEVYKYSELSEEAKERVQNTFCEWTSLEGWTEQAEGIIEEEGFDSPSLSYRLSYSQGDGLSFSADSYDSEKLEKLFLSVLGKGKEKTAKMLANNYCEVWVHGNTGRYAFANEDQIDLYLDSNFAYYDYSNINNVFCEVLEKFENIYMDLCKELEKSGYSELENQVSEEYISKECEENAREFYADGTMY